MLAYRYYKKIDENTLKLLNGTELVTEQFDNYGDMIQYFDKDYMWEAKVWSWYTEDWKWIPRYTSWDNPTIVSLSNNNETIYINFRIY
tara:strand:- start:135 stop:398 length:264 start_codon:yes stop_codon:yes gene_type:complete